MNIKLILLTILFSLVLTINPSVAEAQTPVELVDLQVQTHIVTAKSIDPRTLVLKDYLAKHNSPMQNNALDFVEAADMYGVDWKLVPAIAGVESTFGKRIPGGYNAYGWGVYGSNVLYFKSWKDGIYTLNQGLRENYINKGYTEPYSMNRKYAASPTWGSKVTFFMNDIEKFSKNYDLDTEEITLYPNRTYTTSAQLASK